VDLRASLGDLEKRKLFKIILKRVIHTTGVFVRTIGTVFLSVTEETALHTVAIAASQGSFL
jgi:hypothetical protein